MCLSLRFALPWGVYPHPGALQLLSYSFSSGEFQRRDGLGRGLGGWLGSTTRLYLDTGIVAVPHQMGWDLVGSSRPHQMKV